ncbi:MAG: hypothetical protein ACTSRC_15155 [Candidatus Helarchaeota archaeon]
MPFDPIKEIAEEMEKKMEKILSPGPALCIADGQADIKYIDERLLDRQEYIQNYIRENFNLIEEGQYSLPIPSTLLGFFRMARNLIFIIFMEAGKIGNLLLYRGLLENYGAIVDELYTDLDEIKEIEANANLLIKLRSAGAPAKPEVAAAVASSGKVKEVKAASTTATAEAGSAPSQKLGGAKYPKLLEQYRNKKFNFMEGIILQHCNGERYIEEIVVKSRYSLDEVLEVINTYEKKGWLVMLSRKGAEIIKEEIKESPETKKEVPEQVPGTREGIAEAITVGERTSKVYPELLDKFRNKKFSFQEGLILQFCTGKKTIDEIVKETKFSEADVVEVINTYQKKGWLIIHT